MHWFQLEPETAVLPIILEWKYTADNASPEANLSEVLAVSLSDSRCLIGYHRDMRKTICVLWVLVIVAAGLAQGPKASRPEFKDFAVETVYTGTPAPPKLNSDWRTFRTRIREGAKSPVEFAGHYTVPRWGCGAGCSLFVVVDSITGTVYDGFVVADLPLSWMEKNGESLRMEFHPNSRLIKFNGCPSEQNCGLYDYEMIEGKGLKLVRKELLPKEFQ
jgi:hypothetical protein